LFGPRLRAFFVTGLGFMQVGIWLMMGVLFLGYASVYPVLVPWAEVAAAIRRWLGARGSVAMLFDGSCGVCTRTMRVLRAVDVLGRIEFLDVIGQWPVIASRYPGLDRLQCLADMHVLASDSSAATGFVAYRRLAWRVPVAWLVLPLLYLPPVPQIARRIYRRVADDRMSHGCELPWPGASRRE
ncbi:MAG: DCC1-like thiol-disulfide oxidoreductase family protein, partial [Gemmatimonadota bacterium]